MVTWALWPFSLFPSEMWRGLPRGVRLPYAASHRQRVLAADSCAAVRVVSVLASASLTRTAHRPSRQRALCLADRPPKSLVGFASPSAPQPAAPQCGPARALVSESACIVKPQGPKTLRQLHPPKVGPILGRPTEHRASTFGGLGWVFRIRHSQFPPTPISAVILPNSCLLHRAPPPAGRPSAGQRRNIFGSEKNTSTDFDNFDNAIQMTQLPTLDTVTEGFVLNF